jgi:cell division protein FtsB
MLKSISGRSLAFATVLLVLAITLAPPLHSFFAQRAQIDAYKAQLAASQATLQEAEKELTQWSDSNYVASQARIRLHYVFPGEREYVVLTNTSPTAAKTVPVAPIEGVAPGGTPWYSRLITTITSTGQN